MRCRRCLLSLHAQQRRATPHAPPRSAPGCTSQIAPSARLQPQASGGRQVAALQRDCDAAGRLRAQLGALAAGAAEQTRAESAPAVRGAALAGPAAAPAPAPAGAGAAGERGGAAGPGAVGAAAGGTAAEPDAPSERAGSGASAACAWTGAGGFELLDGGGDRATDEEEAALMRALQGALAQRVRTLWARMCWHVIA